MGIINCKSTSTSYINGKSKELDMYLEDIRNYERLDEKEEINLFTIIQTSNDENEIKKAKDKIIKSNLLFVVSCAKHMPTDANISDLISEGNIGLIYAIDKYQFGYGTRFLSYAVHWIKKYMNNYIINNSNTIKRKNSQKIYNYVNSMKNDFLKKNNREPLLEEVIYELDKKNISFKYIDDYNSIDFISINKKEENDYDNISFEDSEIFNNATATNNIYDDFINNYDNQKKLEYVFSFCKKREITILKELYGIGCEQRTISSISKENNISENVIRNVVKRVIKRIEKK